MNWSKGLFRIWIVLSILWVAFVFSATQHWKYDRAITPPYGKTLEQLTDQEINNLEKQHEKKMSRQFRSAVTSTISFPLFSFLIGFSFLWAFRGFKSK